MRRATVLSLFVMAISLPASVRGQTIDDGIMLVKHDLFTGDFYSHDTWDRYWEGALRRNNGNIGTLTTQTNVWFANYGVTNRLNVIAMLPHVWTSASEGVLHDMTGFQDITIAGKYSVFHKPSTKIGAIRVLAVASAGLPISDYTPDFYPLSIGTGSKRVSGRGTLNVQSRPGWFVNGSGAYTWRAAVTLDRPYYYTDGRLFLTNEVDMPNVFDYVTSVGYMKHGLMAAASFSQQRTLGGGDIRRQDMPFVSNRMNFSKVGGMFVSPIPKLRNFCVELGYAYTLDGRNVGQSSTITAGVLYSRRGRDAQ